ncbi:MAG TPA: hypothetical protein VGC74_01440 [Stenotrophomonas sp.]|jgi:hypothetical protein
MMHANRLFGLSLLMLGGTAAAQQQPTCPTLPPAAGLQWTQLAGADYLSCKALTADGRQVLGLMLSTRSPGLSLSRERREEKGAVEGEDFYWYRPDLGGRELPQLATRRVTVIELGKKRYAQVYIDAGDKQELGAMQNLVQSLDLQPASLALAR